MLPITRLAHAGCEVEGLATKRVLRHVTEPGWLCAAEARLAERAALRRHAELRTPGGPDKAAPGCCTPPPLSLRILSSW